MPCWSGFKWGGVRIPTTRPHQPLASGGHLRRPAKIRHASCALLCHPAEAVCLNNSSVQSTAGVHVARMTRVTDSW